MFEPLQTVWFGIAFTVGDGLTVIKNDNGVPGQPFAVGVMVTVELIAPPPGLVAVNDGMSPLPLVANPIAALLLVQVKVVPTTGLVGLMIAVVAPGQYDCVAMALTVGVGFTVIVNVVGVPVQPLAVGVTVIVPVIGFVPVLVLVNAGTFPLPVVANPIAELVFVQLYVVPAMFPPGTTNVVKAPLQTVWFAIGFTVGAGFTVIVNVVGVPVQPLAVGVTVMVALMGELPVLVAVNAGMVPFPLAARPMAVLLFAQLNVVPPTGPVGVTKVEEVPLHRVWFGMVVTLGVGFTV